MDTETYQTLCNFKMDLRKVDVPTRLNGLRRKILKLYYAKR